VGCTEGEDIAARDIVRGEKLTRDYYVFDAEANIKLSQLLRTALLYTLPDGLLRLCLRKRHPEPTGLKVLGCTSDTGAFSAAKETPAITGMAKLKAIAVIHGYVSRYFIGPNTHSVPISRHASLR
jgi:hypothetical protein